MVKIDGDVDKQGLALEIELLATINLRCSSELNFLGTEKVTRCTFGDNREFLRTKKTYKKLTKKLEPLSKNPSKNQSKNAICSS